ncbi:PTPRM [Mytilus edulis]|uniref:protein-tyrosine-phosphatase n=1 Tax=Mytilus edulis TaxID=6550 RepID=A0A8S3UC44_MYTED|nr:PTPRM [Mytilus edulis]
MKRHVSIVAYKIWKTYAIPRVLYGIEVINFTKSDILKLERLQLKVCRQIQGLPDRTANIATYSLLGVEPVEVVVDRLILTFLGNLLHNKETLEFKILERQLSMAKRNGQSYIIKVIQRLEKYGLPEIETLLENELDTLKWKKTVKKHIIHYWDDKWQEEKQQKSTLKLLNIQSHAIGNAHQKSVPNCHIEPGRFGKNCEQVCHCKEPDCNDLTGHCSYLGCEEEWTGPSCNGDCFEGWTGGSCNECSSQRFGQNCERVCHCQHGECNNITGICYKPGCMKGWTGHSCNYNLQASLTSQLLKPTTLTGYHINDTVQFLCNRGFALVGPDTLICVINDSQTGGKWDNSQPVCQIFISSRQTLKHRPQKSTSYKETPFESTISEEAEFKGGLLCTGAESPHREPMETKLYEERIDISESFNMKLHYSSTHGSESKVVKQFHFTVWPDKNVPKYSSSLVHFRHKVNNTEVTCTGPMVVHCSAGIGRTGTFIGLDYVVNQAKEVEYVDVFGCVEGLRRQRVNMVQTQEQFQFIYEAVIEYLQDFETYSNFQ